MKKFLLLVSAVICSFSAMAQEIQIKKWDASVETLLNRQQQGMTSRSASSNDDLAHVIIDTDDISSVATSIERAGYSVTILNEQSLTANIPASLIPEVAKMEEVAFISGGNKMKLYTDKAIELSEVSKVHNGTQLETPYKGKGVLVGIIDQGFEYQHVAFLDSNKKSRVHSVWNRVAKTEATTTIPTGGEGDNTGGHATHVASIAAGSVVSNVNAGGIAPEATLIMIPSNLNDAEVLEDIKYIYETAKELGMPCAINMSFGGQIGPHDGSTSYNKTIDSYVEKGVVLVAATGNDANDIRHTSYTFAEDGEVRYVFFNNTDTYNYFDIWEQTADGEQHLNVEPCYYSKNKATVTVGKSNFGKGLEMFNSINKANNKQNVNVYNNVKQMLQNCGSDALFGVKITGKKGATFHLWSMIGDVYRPTVFNTAGITSSIVLSGDSNYTVADNACAKKVISVGSYNSGTYRWTPLKGGSSLQLADFKTAGELSDFSNIGPSLIPGVMKPTVVAPGAMINAALNQYSSSYGTSVDQYNYTTHKATIEVPHAYIPSLTEKKHFYYGLKQGTSMSTPVVTGAIALWLEANPELTHEQLIQIFKETSTQDEFTSQNNGSQSWGYGKLNAYKGLVKALELKNSSGINEVVNSESPVSILMDNNEWRVLFNNNETFANIRVCDLNGRIIEQRTLRQLQCGQEEVISMNGKATGVYLISIETTKALTTHKAVVK